MSSKGQAHQIFRLPKGDEPSSQKIAQKYRDLRLTALRLSPESFSSTLEVESQHDNSVWQDRIKRPGFETFICAIDANPNESESFDLADDGCTWIAQVTIRGPISYQNFELPPESGQQSQSPAEASVEERWQVLNLYVHPDYRGRALSQQLCIESFSYLEAERLQPSKTLERLRLRAMAKGDNMASFTLFTKKLGFEVTGHCTLPEALAANGEASLGAAQASGIPRKGWIFTRVIEK